MIQYTNEPTIQVGILQREKIQFILHGAHSLDQATIPTGQHEVCIQNGQLLFEGRYYDSLLFTPLEENCCFELVDVTIGINFHWERNENQRFNGQLKFIVLDNKVQSINIVRVEEYLTSVISSEMSATSSLELLKAHAVISRSWLLNKLVPSQNDSQSSTMVNTPERIIKWYDHQDHSAFDVCADDHCQRYQGITKESTQTVKEAIQATYGQVLTYNDAICDARFYKSCGGATELFENCWEEVHHPYLLPVADDADTKLPDLTQEAEASRWILTSPKAYCNTRDSKVLSQVLNNYDQETADFYRWKVTYSQAEVSQLIEEKTGLGLGTITDIVPIKRGASGRIIELKLIGDKRSLIIGKELEIRKALSKSHLYSSAFVVEKQIKGEQIRFILTGAGWGHGVGLCQIGAAMMASQGIGYKEILSHYYPNSELSELYHNK